MERPLMHFIKKHKIALILLCALGIVFWYGHMKPLPIRVGVACVNPMLTNCDQVRAHIDAHDAFIISDEHPEAWIVHTRRAGTNPDMKTRLHADKNFGPGTILINTFTMSGPTFDLASVREAKPNLDTLAREYKERQEKLFFMRALLRLRDALLTPLEVWSVEKQPLGVRPSTQPPYFVRVACINTQDNECSIFTRAVREHPLLLIPNHATSSENQNRGCANNPQIFACTYSFRGACLNRTMEECYPEGLPVVPDDALDMDHNPIVYLDPSILQAYRETWGDDYWLTLKRGPDNRLSVFLTAFTSNPLDSQFAIAHWNDQLSALTMPRAQDAVNDVTRRLARE